MLVALRDLGLDKYVAKDARLCKCRLSSTRSSKGGTTTRRKLKHKENGAKTCNNRIGLAIDDVEIFHQWRNDSARNVENWLDLKESKGRLVTLATRGGLHREPLQQRALTWSLST